MKFPCAFVLIILACWTQAKLPDFIKTCNTNRSNFVKCIENNANYALPYLLKGSSELNLPPSINLKIPKFHSPSYLPFQLTFNGHIVSLEGVTFNYSRFDLENLVQCAQFNFPKLEIQGKYGISGYVESTRITGIGLANVTLYNVTLDGIWSFAVYKNKGVELMYMSTSTWQSYKIVSASYHFDNLFKGNKTEGETVNKLLNKKWWILSGIFLPSVANVIEKHVFEISNHILTYTTFNEMLPAL